MQFPIKHYLRLITSTSPRIILAKIFAKLRDKSRAYYSIKRDQSRSSFMLDTMIRDKPLNRLFDDLPREIINGDWDWLSGVSHHYLSHRFDLLGSGWVRVYHGLNCRGLEGHCFSMGTSVQADRGGHWLEERVNPANLVESQRIWDMVDVGYCPIDWHLDFKSGYRWREDTWYKNIQFGHLLGVDVKVPWELARMQHLPQLAWAFALAQAGVPGLDASERYAREFRNQVLDFISTNPPRWGVNWFCAMDVALRAVNWLMAYNLFKTFDAGFDEGFENIFFRSIYEHGRHIVENLEWSSEFRSNHYLSDIVGLLFISVSLPCDKETNAWLAFSAQELIKEVKMQFYDDGGNFEASTSYHRLSAELVIYATALLLGLSDEKRQALRDFDHDLIKGIPRLASAPLPFYPLPNSKDESPFPTWYFPRLERMAEFTMHITKPDHHIPQIGDNDSGRFLKLFPIYTSMTVAEAGSRYLNLTKYAELPHADVYWMEDFLDHRCLVAAFNGLFARADFSAFAGQTAEKETMLIGMLSRGRQLASLHSEDEKTAAQNIQVGDISDWLRREAQLLLVSPPPVITTFPAAGFGLRHGLETIAYPDFGLYLFRSKRLYLAVRCGPIGQNGNGGHAHNDQLSIELEIDGSAVIMDSGTYLYTPLPGHRNTYRSIAAHFAPRMGSKEPGDISIGTFSLGGDPKAVAIYFGELGFVGMHTGYACPVYRRITVEDAAVIISDFSPGSELSQYAFETIPFSPAYGIRQIGGGIDEDTDR